MYLQSLAGSINECLAQALVLRDSLQYGAFLSDVANRPLAQSCATQSKYVPTCHRRENTRVPGSAAVVVEEGPDQTIDHNNYVYYSMLCPIVLNIVRLY